MQQTMIVSIVTTMYYSRDYLEEFYSRTMTIVNELNFKYEFIFIDDGSPDDSLYVALGLQNKDNNIKVIQLSRNFGHQKAIMTGLQHASGDYVFLIDCDLEEPPELLKDFWNTITNSTGVDVVYGVQKSRKGGWFERWSGRVFYRMLSILSSIEYPADTLTARIMTKDYLKAVVGFCEKELDLWGVFVLAGFNQQSVIVTKGHKGSSTFTLRKKLKRSVEIVTSLSHRPLYLTFILGLISFAIASINIAIIIYKKLILQIDVEGWASILASIWLVGGMVLLVLGILGIYLSKMFLEIKSRPLTIIKNVFSK
jgi:putative glycosyltransferase